MNIIFTKISRFLVCIALLAAQSAPVYAQQFTGKYRGDRISDRPSSRGLTCNVSALEIEIVDNKVAGIMTWNDIPLKGKISNSGSISLKGRAGKFTYRFKGDANGNKLSGTWNESVSGCKGTWRVSKR